MLTFLPVILEHSLFFHVLQIRNLTASNFNKTNTLLICYLKTVFTQKDTKPTCERQ